MEPAEFVLHSKHLIGGMVGVILHFIEFYLIESEVPPPTNNNCSFFNETLEKLDTISESTPVVKMMLLSILGILAFLGFSLWMASYQKIGNNLFIKMKNAGAVLCFLLYSATTLTTLISDAKGMLLDYGILFTCDDLQSETYRNIFLYTAGKYYLVMDLYLNEFPIRQGFFTLCEIVWDMALKNGYLQMILHLPTYEEAMGNSSSPPPTSYENVNRIVGQLGRATVFQRRGPRNAPFGSDFSSPPPAYQIIERPTAVVPSRRERRTASGPPPVYQASSNNNGGVSAELPTLSEHEAPPSYMTE
ncbi:hypothetical protein B9Z55_024743 [Caenorhabditis nigoni]|uniref:Uncharacterized protein n=1 Tax=Caenorhabditis nigoni TaxID=1611254 RepID=A0A2G5SVS8_9PELO|nr:hypothetical protein B9Z55_024743 [Caenorhabditis nigoni]